MSADLIAYEDCEWNPSINVVNPDGTREKRILQFSVKEGVKIYVDQSLYHGVGEPYGGLENYISEERLQELWSDKQLRLFWCLKKTERFK